MTVWDKFYQRMRKLDFREISDEARYYSSDESRSVEMPDSTGAWRASLEAAFEAGRRWERFNSNQEAKR